MFEIVTGHRHIQVEYYAPVPVRSETVVIFIHGSAGVLTRTEDSKWPGSDNFGERQLVCAGFVVLVPHYFDSTGVASVISREIIDRAAPMWLETLREVLDHAQTFDHAKRNRFAVVSESLGGYLAFALAAQDKRIIAITEFGAGMPHGITISRMPAVLVQHGAKDDVVPISEAYGVVQKAKQLNACVDLKIYECGHFASSIVQKRIVDDIIEFLRGRCVR